jgi:hypothetical protein
MSTATAAHVGASRVNESRNPLSAGIWSSVAAIDSYGREYKLTEYTKYSKIANGGTQIISTQINVVVFVDERWKRVERLVAHVKLDTKSQSRLIYIVFKIAKQTSSYYSISVNTLAITGPRKKMFHSCALMRPTASNHFGGKKKNQIESRQKPAKTTTTTKTTNQRHAGWQHKSKRRTESCALQTNLEKRRTYLN